MRGTLAFLQLAGFRVLYANHSVAEHSRMSLYDI